MPVDASAPSIAVPAWMRASRRLRGFVSLTKPRIIELLLATTLPTMILAAQGWPGTWLTVSTLIGGSLSAASANTFNSYIDRDIDAVMKRTRKRPLVTGIVRPWEAMVFAWVLGLGSLAWFTFVVDSPLATLLTAIAILAYVVGYTMILKRRTSQNIVWGGAAGCMPVFIGWAAVTESLSWTPVLLFLIVFFWTPPHYWPLSMRFTKDYRHASVPMLPVVASAERVAKQMIAYTVAMIGVSLALIPVAEMTWVYAAAAVVSGLWFLSGCVSLYERAARGDAKLKEMRLFRDSITYLTVVFAFVALDPFLNDSLNVWVP